MSKKKSFIVPITQDVQKIENNNIILKNSTKKYSFLMEYKYNKIYLTVSKKNTSDFHIGTFKYTSLDEIKVDQNIIRYLQLEDIEEFFNEFKY